MYLKLAYNSYCKRVPIKTLGYISSRYSKNINDKPILQSILEGGKSKKSPTKKQKSEVVSHAKSRSKSKVKP
jgi:hypothetical protein